LSVLPRIERDYRVRFDESGPDGLLPAAGFLRYAQDLAWVHSNEKGFGREWYGERRLTWLIRAVELELLASVAYGETLRVSTEVLGFRRAWARRRSEFRGPADDALLAWATIDWVLLNEVGAPTRVPHEILDAFETVPGQFTPLRVHLSPTPTDAFGMEIPVRRSELDPMAHVNNAAYLDYIDEHLLAAGREAELGSLPRQYRVEFVAPAEARLTLRGAGWQAGRSWGWRLESHAGRELARATVDSLPRQPKMRS
jgi:medium-chain acyl-[acyl-carrier-protein] hydrolase